MVRRNITEELDGRGEGDPRIQEKSPQPVAIKREKVAAGFCHLMFSPAPRPQLHLCPWLPLCGLPLGPYLYSDEFSIPPHTHSTRTQLLGDLGRRALSQDNCLERLYFNSVFTGDLLRVIRSFKRMSY